MHFFSRINTLRDTLQVNIGDSPALKKRGGKEPEARPICRLEKSAQSSYITSC
jgi:hypothetical protein